MSLFNFFQKKEYSIGIVPGKETQKMLTNIGTLLQLFCNHVLSLIKNWRFLYKYALTCYYLSIYLKGVNKYAARYS
jgi:hypothetical protein